MNAVPPNIPSCGGLQATNQRLYSFISDENVKIELDAGHIELKDGIDGAKELANIMKPYISNSGSILDPDELKDILTSRWPGLSVRIVNVNNMDEKSQGKWKLRPPTLCLNVCVIILTFTN